MNPTKWRKQQRLGAESEQHLHEERGRSRSAWVTQTSFQRAPGGDVQEPGWLGLCRRWIRAPEGHPLHPAQAPVLPHTAPAEGHLAGDPWAPLVRCCRSSSSAVPRARQGRGWAARLPSRPRSDHTSCSTRTPASAAGGREG